MFLSLSINVLLTINVIVSLLIILVVLMQRPKSEGLGAAFGGGMTENLFGAQTTNVLANFTRWLGGLFFLLTLILSILYAKQSTQRSSIQAAVLKQAAAATPAASASPVASTAAKEGTAAITGTAAVSGTEAAFSGASVKLAPEATPTGPLAPKSLTEETPSAAPSPAASPAASGSTGH